MADPTLSLSFSDLIIRVAEYLGMAYYGASGAEVAQVPQDAHDLELCKRLVNDGYRKFINSNPRWQFLTPTISVTFVAGQTAYALPDGFYGSILKPWTYPPDGPRIDIAETTEAMIRDWSAGGDVSGDPSYVAYRPTTPITNTTTGSRWEAVFWPTPGAVYTVTTRARLYPEKLSDLSDKHIAGFQHDETIIAAALAEAERQRNDTTGVQAANFKDSLSRSLLLDKEAAPKRLGGYGDRSDDRMVATRPYTGVDTYNNNPV
jgi:hypothetical protein